ncbi:MAG: type 2 lanthipeptide synthetase LanM family protein [Ktedonobacteraceae bacterium]
METQSERLTAATKILQQTSHWYRAATLTERLVSWPDSATPPLLNEHSISEEAEKTWQRWKAQMPFSKDSFFIDRLAMDGITERDLLALLDEPLEVLEKRLSSYAAPDWVVELVGALQTSPAPLSQDMEDLFSQFAIVRPWYPLMYRSIRHVQAGIKALAQEYDMLPFDPATILSLLLPNLCQQLQMKVSKTMVLELNIARMRGHLQGETSEERFQSYLHMLNQTEHLTPLLEEYVVLARQVLVSSQLWAACSLEFLQRLCADWPEILSEFAPEQKPGTLIKAAAGAGDMHRGGHSVMILTFHSGWRLLYKPKSLTIDVHFQEVLAWLNARGSHPMFRLLKLIDKTLYGWTEFIIASGCSSSTEVERFYERQGGYLALLYLLDATDFHHENVIAAGEHPLLIDLEALFHPHPNTTKTTPSQVQKHLEHSVQRIALLPCHVFLNEEGEGLDISGLGQVGGQLSPRPLPLWEGVGTDEMKLIHKRVELPGGYNLPQLHDQKVQPLDYLEHLIFGFTTIYQLLITYREELLTTILPRFAHDEIRFVARATRTYSLLLTESFHPNMLRDALKRERFFDRLWMEVEHRPSLAQLIPAERADLLQGDIPLFTTRPASRDLWTSRGDCLPAFFAESSLELVSRRLQLLNEADLQQQIWIIRASFANIAGQRGFTTQSAEEWYTSGASAVVEREQLLAEARAIGERLCARALREKELVDWFGVTWLVERDWQITSTGLDLFSGLPGILLFLGYLDRITGEANYTAIVQTGLNTMRAAVKQFRVSGNQGGIGAFTGLSSCLYLLTHLAAIWNDPSLLQEAEELAQLISGWIEKDEMFDLVDGAAGCIACLLTLYAVAPSPEILLIAVQCGEHLLAHAHTMPEGVGWKTKLQDVPLAGFAHGVAGIAWSLLRLAEVSGQERFREIALQALAYERSLFSSQQRNWHDMRKRLAVNTPEQQEQGAPAQAPEVHYGMSWNHGAPGVALGRLISLPYLDDAFTRAEIETALETTLANGFGYCHELVGPNHSLLHGDCGNLETVLLAAQTLRTPELHEHLQRLMAHLLESMHQRGWVMGIPLNIETPGLLLGLAGIGYQCLRLAEPEGVPSILALAPPRRLEG